LHLMNNGMVHELAESLARRVESAAGPDAQNQVKQVYLIALGRAPNADEMEIGRSSLARMTERWAVALTGGAKPDNAEAARKALTTFCHAILNSAEFLYVD
jgi:hypothetical protein